MDGRSYAAFWSARYNEERYGRMTLRGSVEIIKSEDIMGCTMVTLDETSLI
jgi:hypothetical protein